MALRSTLLAIASLALLMTGAQASPPPPHVAAANFDALAQPLPLPYDEAADAEHQIATARAHARVSGKRLLIDMGGNWCLDCRILAGTLALPEVRAFVRRHYDWVTVNIGRYDKNQQIVRHYGLDKLDGVPALFVVDPRSDRLLNQGHLFALTDARHMNPQALADFLAMWA